MANQATVISFKRLFENFRKLVQPSLPVACDRLRRKAENISPKKNMPLLSLF